MKKQPFRVSLGAQPSYRLGEPILVDFGIENTGSENYQVLKWATPLEGQVTANFLTVERDGVAIRYDGKFVKRGDPPPDAYVVFRPGERLTSVLDVSDAYAIDQVGHYKVMLNASFIDAFAVPDSTAQAPRKRADHQLHKLPASAVEFDVVSGTEPKLTEGQKARKAASRPKSSAKAPSFTGGTTSEQTDTLVAHENAQYFAALAKRQLDTGPASTNALYQTWFGAFDQGRYDAVTVNFSEISTKLETEDVTYDLSQSGCQAGWYAYTYDGSRTVYLCSAYISAPDIGTDCKFGTLIHEWSHAFCGTDDHVYGMSGCQNLAVSSPTDAIDNADSHEYFCERLAQTDFGKSVTLVTDRSTFGKDEVNVLLGLSTPAIIPEAFYVIADGYWPDKLGITAATLGASPSVKPAFTVAPTISGMTISVTSLDAEDIHLPATPQRFTWVCQIAFNDVSGFPANPGQVQTLALTATLVGQSSSAHIRLICEPNPYELDGPISWLSTDVRVFQIHEGETRFGVTMGSTPSEASQFIKQVVANLNTGASGGQTYDSISTDIQTSALELSEKVGGMKVFNFAVAKVRYRGSIDISSVRLFFRLVPASTTSLYFDANTTYRRATQGTTIIPLLGLSAGGDLLSIPCFAEPRVDSSTVSMTTQTDPTNVQTIPHATGAEEASVHFGCWLDINQTHPQFPVSPSPSDGPWASSRKSVQELMRNAHQCLIAEIAFDPDPIPQDASPGGSDKLAQRNLAIVESANPGYEASRRILTTFEIRPIAPSEQSTLPPDELLINWGDTPTESIATVYMPEVEAARIIALADECYGVHRLIQTDSFTVRLAVGGISYIPLPRVSASGVTGLLSVDLPDTVRKGDVYSIVVRQLTNTMDKAIPHHDAAPTYGQGGVVRWRRVVGSYQVTVPIRSKEVILPREARLLSVLRWILESVPAHDRWYPVFSRYVHAIAERVRALGGDPALVVPSPDGSGGEIAEQAERGAARERRYDGKVSGLVYDCFGDFEGFLLDDCGNERRFYAREHQIEALVKTAWLERMAVTVVPHTLHPLRPLSIILRRTSEPFQS